MPHLIIIISHKSTLFGTNLCSGTLIIVLFPPQVFEDPQNVLIKINKYGWIMLNAQ